jgi:hypothetical protein
VAALLHLELATEGGQNTANGFANTRTDLATAQPVSTQLSPVRLQPPMTSSEDVTSRQDELRSAVECRPPATLSLPVDSSKGNVTFVEGYPSESGTAVDAIVQQHLNTKTPTPTSMKHNGNWTSCTHWCMYY